MKKIIVVVAFLLSVTGLANAQVAADFKFEKETHDFGNILMTKPATVEFKYTNVGDVPLIITNVTAPCGCTVPQWTKTPVKKGETGIITVTYTPNPSQPLPFTKQVTITSNAKLSTKVLYIKGISVASLPVAIKD
ncbi:MAG: DUF1573 domain-containing protein [Bacteroidota bacterium]